ncbi:hypothetical protein [Cerasicoccus maritimus]|uniref:hypothetical protein n=1 Tax=Cerasicoccus maritimus TaxID=490089 RepID=UPI00285251A5|nr:hypothetical protein [Cerasicoccus maritimus]
MSSIQTLVVDMWNALGGKPDNGAQAIRGDLGFDRAFAAMVGVGYHAPFNSIEKDTRCDISDNGLIEVDISQFDTWKIYHIEIGWLGDDDGKEGMRTLIGEMSIDGFSWEISERELDNLGEGLF